MPGREKEKYDKSKVEGKQIIWIMGKFFKFCSHVIVFARFNETLEYK